MTCGQKLQRRCILSLRRGKYRLYLPEYYLSILCFQRPYRAPELLFGPHTYDAFATDLWSLGAVFAEFFTALRLTRLDEEYEAEDGDIVAEEEDRNIPFILPKDIRAGDPNTRWQRDPLFDGTKGEIGLAWSIFKIRGTPTAETWPVKHFISHISC